jgi:hypothetical protein
MAATGTCPAFLANVLKQSRVAAKGRSSSLGGVSGEQHLILKTDTLRNVAKDLCLTYGINVHDLQQPFLLS